MGTIGGIFNVHMTIYTSEYEVMRSAVLYITTGTQHTTHSMCVCVCACEV